jgi:hypothetical protein
MKHTAGPWRADTCRHQHVIRADWHGQDSPIAVTEWVADEEPYYSEMLANALLIAAAPDAHEILLAIHEFFRHHNPVDPSALVLGDDRTLKQAVADYLAKAAGQPS